MKNINTNNKNIIGKGLFSTCYLQADKKTVVLKSVDGIKECMSMGWFPSNNCFPKVEYIEQGLYKMKYYKKVSSLKNELKPKQYAIYQELRKLTIGYVKNSYNSLEEWIKQFKTVSNKTMSKALINAIEACANYGSDISFEISPRNVAVNNGNLILLDCFFVQSEANKQRTK